MWLSKWGHLLINQRLMFNGIYINVLELEGKNLYLKIGKLKKKKKESRINEIQIIQYFTTKPQRSRLLGNSNCFELNTTLGKPVLA